GRRLDFNKPLIRGRLIVRCESGTEVTSIGILNAQTHALADLRLPKSEPLLPQPFSASQYLCDGYIRRMGEDFKKTAGLGRRRGRVGHSATRRHSGAEAPTH